MTTRIKRHPVRGAIAGLCLGLGVSLLLLIFSVWVVKTFEPYAILIGACLLVGILWGFLAPARVRGAVRSSVPTVPAGPSGAASAPPSPAPPADPPPPATGAPPETPPTA